MYPAVQVYENTLSYLLSQTVSIIVEVCDIYKLTYKYIIQAAYKNSF